MRRRWSPASEGTTGLDADSAAPAAGAAEAGAVDPPIAGVAHAARAEPLHAPADGAWPGAGLAGGHGHVFMPTGYEPGYAYPLLVWLTGRPGGRFDLGRTMATLSLRNYLAVQPLPAADDADIESAVWRAIDVLQERVAVHPERIFLLGRGRGGTEAFRIACRHATTFAGAVSIDGPFPHGERAFARLADVRRLPMLFCCRENAPPGVVRPTDATLRLFHAAGAMLAMRIYPAREQAGRAILADVNRWLMDEISGTSLPRKVSCG